jgi:hypothetical protein
MVVTPGDANPAPRQRKLHVYIAIDYAKTVVALLPPLVTGTAKHATTGSITYVRPYSAPRQPGSRGALTRSFAVVQVSPARSGAALVGNVGGLVGLAIAGGLAYATTPWLGLPVGAAVAALGYWPAAVRQRRVQRAWPSSHRVLTDHRDREVLLTALSTALRALNAWPALRATLPLDDPSPVLASTLWDLATILSQRATVRETHDKLTRVAEEVPDDSSVHTDVAARLAQAEATRRRLDGEIERRLRDLTTLADEADKFVRQQEALSEARAVMQDADEVLGTIGEAPQPAGAEYPLATDASTDLVERTTAVLAAYRELTNQITDQT